MKKIEDYMPVYSCRFHPVDWWHETGCTHRDWTKEELQGALDLAKKSEAYRIHIMNHPEDTLTAKDYAAPKSNVGEK